ncbi:MAG: sugar transporter [Yoonia sp.]|uniref:sugar transporter n=1 Tax=Yoonia sp. TaxID=2212373 RepID=UPI003266F3EA
MADAPKTEAPKTAPKPKVAAKPAATAKPAPKPKPAEQTVIIKQSAGKSRAKKRHWGLLTAFVILVILPVLTTWWYLEERAADQYASTLGFTVRSEDISSAADLLGGLAPALGGSSGSPDADILYEFIRSQSLVQQIDDELDLRALYTQHLDTDPIFSFDPEGSIEDLTTYWQRMVRISYDASSGLMELRILAFDPVEAQQIANLIVEKSSTMINNLSAIAREDATRYARADLDLAVERLKQTREALTAFRIANEIVDPTADVQGQMGLLNLLQSQQVAALIDFDLLSDSTSDRDPRLVQARRRLDIIEARIREERRKFGVGNAGDNNASYAETIAGFERLTVDRQFAEQAYAAALASFDGARAEANRKSRYLAAYITPTLAERSKFPNRALLIGIVTLFSFLGWAIMALAYYALQDRR